MGDIARTLYTADQVRELDRRAIEDSGIAGITLMRRAAGATVDALLARWPGVRSVGVYCGSGNNAGDGYIAAGLLADRGIDVRVVSLGNPNKLGTDARAALRFCERSPAAVADSATDCDVLVDALLGTGISGDVRADYVAAIRQINSAGRPVVSVDVPSGLSVDSGQILGIAVRASVTVTFIGVKRGLLTGAGPDCCGELVFADLDVPAEVYDDLPPSVRQLDFGECLALLDAREQGSFKNNFGHLLVAGGDVTMCGAVSMAAEAALRTGAGLVSVATAASNVAPILARRPELMVRGVSTDEELDPLIDRASCFVLGPGLGTGEWGRWLFDRLIASGKPGVLDADGLNLLAERPRAQPSLILTPHPGEASRLLGGREWLDDRFAAVNELGRRYGGVVLLKGVGTLITGPGGASLCPYGNPGMATAGMGDVLSGIIGGLLAQGMAPQHAAELGATLHASAADVAAARDGMRGLIATDLMAHVRALLG
ncbi:MAG: NAD(P)H-hydrate dehydratase [Proteobacteria bacterium]|jgi:hydroxyethylthiazole kinase-like uncharacterized protein yjeF|nr:NAD(P)H-hydrate dehydratase [Pseudomonadota bacterium]